MSSTAETLRRARALIECKSRWCRGELHKVRGGKTQFCAIGAVHAVSSKCGPRRLLYEAAQEEFNCPTATVNDTLGHAAVMRMYDRAIEMAEEQDDAE